MQHSASSWDENMVNGKQHGKCKEKQCGFCIKTRKYEPIPVQKRQHMAKAEKTHKNPTVLLLRFTES